MQRVMMGLDGVIGRRRWVFVGVWAVLLVAALPFAVKQSDHLTGGGFNVPGSQAENVRLAMDHGFAGGERATLGVVLVPATPAGSAAARRALRHELAVSEAIVQRTAHVSIPLADRKLAAAMARRGGTTILPVPLSVTVDQSIDVATHLRTALDVTGPARGGVARHVIGQGALWSTMQDLSKQGLSKAESTGFPIVLLILMVVFGSLAAAALPLALGVVSVMITGALIYFLSQVMEMSVFVTNMASMIGIGVAVDYSLFVLARYREEIAAGRSVEEARGTALATSGVAVLFSGLTVIVSLGGLWMVDNPAVRSMALGAMLVVAVSVLGAATLLPALVALLGERAAGQGRVFAMVNRRWCAVMESLSWRDPERARSSAADAREVSAVARAGFWMRWTSRVTRRPALTAAAAASVLAVLAVPLLSISIGTGALQQFPAGNETAAGVRAAAKVSGPGDSSPVFTLVNFSSGTAATKGNHTLLGRLERTIAADHTVARLDGVELSRNRRGAVITAIPAVQGETGAAKQLVARLRSELPRVAGRGAHVEVGGTTAQQLDIANLISGSMWKILLFVLGLSYLVLLILLRSVVLPLKAVVMNLLSVGAGFGALVAVFQWGWLDGLLGVTRQGHLDALTPPLVLAVVFGLSMDYEVFLLTRIRERWEHTGDSRGSVAEGLQSSARTITSAALIMTSVFAVFLGTGIPSIQEIGIGCAVAVAVDATLVRLVLVPATMELLGDWNWWLPRWLARLLPNTDFERAPSLETPSASPTATRQPVTA